MFFRYAKAITTGSAVTLSLLWVMQSLINLTAGEDPTARVRHELGFLPLVDEKPVVTEDLTRRYEDLKDPLDQTPPRVHRDFGFDGSSIGVKTRIAPEPTLANDGIGVYTDGPLVAMVRVQPVYPVRATEMNLDGYVIVEFDVNADGTVSNVRVIESSHKVFNKAAIRAAEGFRYKPPVVDGVPQRTTGVRNLFRFEMDRT